MLGLIDRAEPVAMKRMLRPLLSSCALAAALVFAGQQAAQAQSLNGSTFTGFDAVGTGSGATVNADNGAGTSRIGITQSQVIIDWVPNATATSANGGTGTIAFMPGGRSVTFESGYGYTGGYTVLNRIDNATTPLTRPIGLDGTIASTVNGQRGGNVWFYSPGGIIAGPSSVFNVGSLVLTTNTIDTTGGLYGFGNTIRFRGPAGSTAAVAISGPTSTAPGAQINLTNANSYLAVVAPVVNQAGTVDVNGSAAYVSGERVDIGINGNLFNISFLTGSNGDGDAANGTATTITHSGSTTSTVAATGATDDRRIYFVAVPKNDAVTMLVSGNLGYPAATTAGVENGQVILSAGYSVFGSSISTFPSGAGGAASLKVAGGTVTSRVNAGATDSATFDTSLAPLTISGPVDIVAGDALLDANNGRTLSITGNTTLRSIRPLSGTAAASAGAGSALTVTGNLLLDTNATGFVESGYGSTPATAGQGGISSLTATGANAVATVTGNLTVRAIGTGAAGSSLVGGAGQGGSASVVAQTGGVVAVNGPNTTINASATGGTSTSGPGGAAQGGTATLLANGGTVTLAGTANVVAGAQGSASSNGAAGVGTGGTATLSATNGTIGVQTTLNANAAGRSGSGPGVGGTVAAVADAGTITAPTTVLGTPAGANGLVSIAATGSGGMNASTLFRVYANNAQLTHATPTRATVASGTFAADTIAAFDASATTAITATNLIDILAGTTLNGGNFTATAGDVDLDSATGTNVGTVTAGDTATVSATNGPATVAAITGGTNNASTDPDFGGDVGVTATGNVSVGSATALGGGRSGYGVVGLLSQTGTVGATVVNANDAAVLLAGGDVAVGTATANGLFYVGAPGAVQTLFDGTFVLGGDNDDANVAALEAAGVTRAGGNVGITGSVTANRALIGAQGTLTGAAAQFAGNATFEAGGILDMRALTVGGTIRATGSSITLIGPAAFDLASANVTRATGNLTVTAGTTLTAGNLAAGGSIALSGAQRVTTGNLQANNRITAASANGPVSIGNAESVGGSVSVSAGGDLAIGNVRAAGSIFLTSTGAITGGDLTAGTGPILPGAGDGAIPTSSGIAPGFDSSSLVRCDDSCSSSAVPLPFTANYFGRTYSNTFVNNNGYVTFVSGQSDFTPTGLGAGYSGNPIIAAFFADVDTRNAASAPTTYGTGTYAGRPAFGVTWNGVGYYDTQADKLNNFQIVLTDRSDTGAGNFDIYYNYTSIRWETGSADGGVNGFGGTSAAVGYNAGTGNQPGTFFELPGSRVPGTFLDNGTAPLIATTNVGVPGQLAFAVRNGAIESTGGVPTINVSNASSTGNAGITLGNLSASAVNVTGGAGTTANFQGNIAAGTISIASSDLIFRTDPQTRIGVNTDTLTLTNNGSRRSQLGGNDAAGTWSLSNDEFGRLSARTITINAPDAQDDSADLTVSRLDVIGSAGADTTTRRRNLTGSTLVLNSADELLVNGPLALTGAGADNLVSLTAPFGIGVDTATGSINLTGANNALAGTLRFDADRIFVGSVATGQRLLTTSTIGDRDSLLGTNDGPVNPAGFIQAGGLIFRPSVGLYVQNSGPSGTRDPDARAGFTAGSGGVTILTDAGEAVPEVIINGRQALADGSFITGAALVSAINFSDGTDSVNTAATPPRVAPGSTVNSCLILGDNCSRVETPAPPIQDVIRNVFDPTSFLTTLLETPLIELADFVPFSLEPLIDDPVTGAGNDDMWLGGEKRDGDDKRDGGRS